jgi:hypothetical protein
MDNVILIWLAIVPVAIVGQIYLLGRRMSSPEKMIKPTTSGLSQLQQGTIDYYQDWLTSVNLEFCTAFRFSKIDVVVFQQRDKPRYLSFMFHKQLVFGAESYLADLTVLDTGTSNSGGLFPRPGAYGQGFPGISVVEAWQRHLEAEEYLSAKFGYDWKPLSRPYLEILAEAMRLRMKYNRSQFLWPFRVLYRFAVTRHLRANRTIAQQFP